jgi:transposase
MAWADITRRKHRCKGLRNSSDMRDRKWMVTAPFILAAKRGGRRRTTDMGKAVTAMVYIAASECAWRLLPKCFPPLPTVRRCFYAWRHAGLFDLINMASVDRASASQANKVRFDTDHIAAWPYAIRKYK